MFAILNRISLKLSLVCLSFTLPIAVMLKLMIDSKQKDIDFAAWEEKGDFLQRPLEQILKSLSHQRDIALRLAHGDSSLRSAFDENAKIVDKDLAALKEAMAVVATDLQFTADGLGKRQRQEFTVERLDQKWADAKKIDAAKSFDDVNKTYKDLSMHVRTMITHTGDVSNLILDPDLDSYYLMDVTLLALPQTQDRLQEINSFVQYLSKQRQFSQADRVQASVYASFLREADLDRINGSSQTSLNEDANFYGTSESLQKNLSAAMKENAAAVEPVIDALKNLALSQSLQDVDFEKILNLVRIGNDALYKMHNISFDELDHLLDRRKDSFHNDVKKAIVWTTVSLAISVLLALLITVNIISRVKRVNETTKKIANGDLAARVRMVSGDEIGELARSFDSMTDKVEGLNREIALKNDELVGINGNLERMVAERTATIKTILDNVKFGFLLVNKDLVVQDGYSRSCADLLGTELKAGVPFLKSIGVTGTRHEAMMSEFLNQAFEDMLPEEMTLHQLPPRVQLGEKILSIQGSAIRNANNEVSAILFTLIDATSVEKMEKENHRHKVLVRLLKEHESFKDFMEETKTRLHLCRKFMANGEQGKVRGELHTMKGNTAAYDMIDIAKQIHVIEDAVNVSLADIDRVEAAFIGFLETNFDVLQLNWSGDSVEQFSVSKNDLDSIIERVRRSAGTDMGAVAELADWASTIQLKSARSLVGALPDYGERLALRLGKPCKIRVEGGDVRMDPEVMRPIMQSLVHLVRNAIDHGIEAPYERGEKPEEGSILIRCSDDDKGWTLVITDDGRGIEVDRVAKKAVESGQVSADKIKSMSDKDKCKLVFLAGVSTSEEVTEISGRGVGMSAVATAVQEAGGVLEIDSVRQKGTSVTLRVPKSSVKMKRAA